MSSSHTPSKTSRLLCLASFLLGAVVIVPGFLALAFIATLTSVSDAATTVYSAAFDRDGYFMNIIRIWRGEDVA